MKSLFQCNQNLKLTHMTVPSLKSYLDPKVVQCNYAGFTLLEQIKKKTPVYPGMLLAEHPSPSIGDLFSPIHGVVNDINKNILYITATEPETNTSYEDILQPSYSNLKGSELAFSLKKLGVNIGALNQPCETLIINALNPEPGMVYTEAIIQKESETLTIGLELCKNITQAKNIILALPRNNSSQKLNDKSIPTVYIKPIYPNNIDQLIIKKITKQESPKNVLTVSLHTIWGIGRVATLGQPLTETILTISNQRHAENYIVKEGTTIKELITFSGLQVNDGDTVIDGGLFQGKSIDQLQYGITKDTKGIFITYPTTTPSMKKNYPCINCGACVSICPARLNPNLISRYTEFRLYEKCQKEFIESCFECGLCSYVCVARRPILEQIRLAKHALNITTI